nr:hypothetical protein [Tanacetum cinerariifolium]
MDTTPRDKNDNQSEQFGNQRMMNVNGARENECRKPKTVKDSAYHKEMMLMCKQAEKAQYTYMEKIQEVPTIDTCTDSEPLEKMIVMSFLIHPICVSDDERVMLANLIANLKLDVDENKKIQMQLKKENTTLAQELKECKTILAKTSKTLGESNSVWDSCLVALQNTQTEFEKYKAFNDRTIDYDKLERKLNETLGQLAQKDIEIKEVDSNHFACVTKMLNDVNARTKKPNVVPISTRNPKGHANKSVATYHKKKVASKSTNQKPQNYFRMLYEKTSKTWKWWIEQQSPSGYKWVPKTKMQWVPKAKNENVQKRIVQLILFIIDSGCTKHMTSNLKLVYNFVEKFMGTVHFGNDQFAPILGYGDLVQGNITINRVYYVRASITISSKLVSFVMRIWRLLSGNLLVLLEIFRKDVVIGLPKLKYVKDQLWSSCELSKAKRSSFKSKAVSSLKGRPNLLHMDLCGPMRVASINGKKYILGKMPTKIELTLEQSQQGVRYDVLVSIEGVEE